MNFKHCLFLLVCLSMTVFHSCKDDTDDREAFISTYTIVINCDGDPFTYDMSISLDEDSEDGINITNLFGNDLTTPAKVSGKTLSINHVFNDDGYTYTAIATGTLNETILELTITIQEDGYSETCSGIATKK